MNYGDNGNSQWPLLFKMVHSSVHQFVFEKIIKIVANRCQILSKMHEILFRAGCPSPLATPASPFRPRCVSVLMLSVLGQSSAKLNTYQQGSSAQGLVVYEAGSAITITLMSFCIALYSADL